MRKPDTINLLLLLALGGFVLTGCNPEDVSKARREATSKAVEVKDATTQKAEEIKEQVRPYVERGVEKAREIKAAATQKASELREEAQPYIDKAKAATTQAVEEVKQATTRAVEKVRGQ